MHIGVDTHTKRHVLVALDARGQTCGTHSVANKPAGWAAALHWARERDTERVWGVENRGAFGKGFAQFLLTSGERAVHEIVPHRTAQYRKRGRSQDKTDQTDALAMARLLQAEREHLPRVERDDVSTALRLLSDHRDNRVAERTRLVNQLHAQMLPIDPCSTEQRGALTSRTGIRYGQALALPHANSVVQMRLLIVRQLSEQILQVWEEIETVEAALAARVRATETPRRDLCGAAVLEAAVGRCGRSVVAWAGARHSARWTGERRVRRIPGACRLTRELVGKGPCAATF